VASIQARSIQALQQATSILSKITGAMGPRQEAAGAPVPVDAGNSFGGVSYGSQHVHFQQGLPGRGGPRTMSKVKSGDRRAVGSASSHRNQDVPEVQQVGKCEMDSHADTCCLGANFIPIYFTGKICNVAPFLSNLPSQEGIPICSGATAFENANGCTYILIVNEALWFGDQMKNSLINPNQVRAFGVSLYDNPTDQNCHLGMTVQDQLIPFVMAGSTCHFTTRTLMNWEMENCLQLEITSDAEDPGDHEDSLESSFVVSYDTRHRRPDVEPSYLAK